MTNIDRDLESRITTRCMELVKRLEELETDTRIEAEKVCARLQATLAELGQIIEGGIVDGWAPLSDQLRTELDTWLGETAAQLEVSTKDRQS